MNPTVKYTSVVYRPSSKSNNQGEDGHANTDGQKGGSGSTVGKNLKSKRLNKGHFRTLDVFDATSSILSDYEDLLLDGGDDDQSLYILFNPVKSVSSARNESDILSFTNTTAEDQVEEDDEEGDEEGDEVDDEEDEEIAQQNQDHDLHPIQDRSVRKMVDLANHGSNLSNKINNWYNSSVYLSDNMFIDDNIASWNLDENLMDHSKLLDATDQEKVDRPILDIYGSDLLQYLDQEDLAKFKRFHRLIDIKKFLLAKNSEDTSTTSATGSNTILNQIILKLILATRGAKETSEVECSVDTKAHAPTYVNHMRSSYVKPEVSFVSSSTFSDTTGGSSLILCGGVGFGGSSSWNEL